MERDFDGRCAERNQQQRIKDGFSLCYKNKTKTKENIFEELKISFIPSLLPPLPKEPFKIYNFSFLSPSLSESLGFKSHFFK